MKTASRLATLAALGAMSPGAALAAGFQLNEHNAAATGRAGAVVATTQDASAIFFNPAGLTGVDGTELQLGVQVIRPSGQYVGPGLPSTRPEGATGDVTQNAKQPFVPIPYFFGAHQLSEKAYVGLGVYLPYGLGLSWEDPDSFVGRTISRETSLRTVFITPTIALELSKAISVAVSVSLVPASVFLERTLGTTDNGQVLFPRDQFGDEGIVQLSGSAFGVGANAGIQLTLMESLKIGAVFRSAVGLDFTGNADFQIPETAAPAVRANFPDGPINAETTLPHTFGFGVGWDDGPLVLEATATLTLWNSFDELRFNFDSGKPSKTSFSPRDWTAVPTFRLGGQYTIAERFTPRLGVAYDVNPVPDETIDPSLPDNDRFIVTAGFGAKFGPVEADIAYMLLLLGERQANDTQNFAPGTYPSRRIDLFALTLGVGF